LMPPGSVFAAISLFFGAVFFAYAARYYLFTATVFILQFISSLRNANSKSNRRKGGNSTGNLNGFALGLDRDRNNNSNRNRNHEWQSEPLVSIHVATYNERNVINRLLASCMSLDYSNYEVIIVDDSTDETVDILERWKRSQVELNHATDGGQIQQVVLELRKPALKIIHREKRTGFKGGALNEALRHMDPNAEYVIVLDADFVPAPDLIRQFLTYVHVADVASLFGDIVTLDSAFASGEVELDGFLQKRENLVAKVASRRIESVAEGGRMAILELDRLYSENVLELETYLRRRQLILDILETLGVDPLVYEPFGDRSSLINSFELDQLMADERIELSEYVSRRKLIMPKKERPPETRKVTAEDIMNLDRLYAEGRIADQAWYLRERAWLVQRLPSEAERKRLQELFEIDQLFSQGVIDINEFAERRRKLARDQEENDEHLVGNNGKPILWRGRKNSNRNNKARIWRLGNRHESNENSNHKRDANGPLNNNTRSNGTVAAIQGYQWHYLNKSENWLTLGIRAEYSGNYVIERTCEEIFGGMKMIAGSVYMIRADLLKKYGWSTSLTEDWELTCRLYGDGYRVQYTPQIQVPAECPSRVTRLIRQRQRWAEGHTFNAKKYFWKILKSSDLTLREKLEFVYFAPYYLQSVFFMIGTTFWMLSESMHAYLPFWTATFGWSLLLTNLIALPLMSLAGLYAEESARKDLPGVFSTIVMSYILAPFQAYSALKGLLEKEEGLWIRTFKTGKITEPIIHAKLVGIGRRLRSKSARRLWFRPLKGRKPAEKKSQKEKRWSLTGFSVLVLLIMTTMNLSIILGSLMVPEARANQPPYWGQGMSSWSYRKKLTFDNSGQAENLLDFAVLVHLTTSNFDFSHAQSAGQDIRFLDSDDSTTLEYEIEKWTGNTEAWIWVKVPQIDASSSADYIWMYYGNSGVSDAQDAANGWDGNFKGVWHLKENPAASAAQMKDGISNANHGTSAETMTAFDQVTAKMDEVRVSNTGRSAKWIKAQYLNVTDAFTTFGSEINVPENALLLWLLVPVIPILARKRSARRYSEVRKVQVNPDR